MYSKRMRRPVGFLALLLILLSFTLAAFAESAVQELLVPNTPIKGQITVEKQGLVLTGFVDSSDSLGYTVHTPIFASGCPQGAVFEVRAAEEIIGKDGTKWFDKDDLAATITTSGSGADASPLLPLGRYYVTEVTAPDGYICDPVRQEVTLSALDNTTAVIEATLTASNDYLPAEVSLVKLKDVVTYQTTEQDMIQSQLEAIPGEGFVFGLFNAGAIPYGETALEADSLIAVGITDADGKLTFAGMYPHGTYYIKELAVPDGWKLSEERYPVSISPESRTEDNVIRVALEEPIHNELIHAGVNIAKTDITGSDYLPGTLVEVWNAQKEIVLRAYTKDDGYTPSFHAVPSDYTFREVLAPEGYELCTTELEFTVNAEGKVEGQTTVQDDYNRFSILKVDEQHQPLAGVVFGLYREDETLVCTATTDENGLATFEKIPYGSYFIQELTPLPGYIRDYTRTPVTIDGRYINPTEPLATISNCPTEILLQKVDEKGAALPGAEFGLFDEDGSLIQQAVSDTEGILRFTHVPYGTYTIRETAAPAGYLLSKYGIRITLNEGYVNAGKPVTTITDQPKRITYLKVNPSGKPIAGVAFSLIEASTEKVVETVTSDANGVFTFTQIDYGDWIIRETAAPEGYSRMADKHLHIGADWKMPEPIMCVNIPNHYEFLKTDASGTPLAGIKFRLESESGKDLGTFVSSKDGIVRMTELTPGTYYIKEIETLEGFSLSGEAVKFTLDEHYVVPDQMKRWINYTVIQTGVNLAITATMWIGMSLIVLGGVVLFIRKKRGTMDKK